MFDKLRTYFEKQFPITDEQFDFMKALFTPKKVLTSYKTTTFFVSPNIGYFVIPKLVGGLRLNVSLYKQNTAVLYSDKYFSLAIFTILFALPKAKVQRLVDASYINVKSKTRIQSNPTLIIERTTGYNMSVGPSIFLNEHVALEFLLSCKQTRLKDYGENKTTTFNAVLGLQIHLGEIKTEAKV